jgi:hypothetical protein
MGEEMAIKFCLRSISFHALRVLLRALSLRHGINGFTYPPKEVMLRILIALKNPLSWVKFESVNCGSTTTRPLRADLLVNNLILC